MSRLLFGIFLIVLSPMMATNALAALNNGSGGLSTGVCSPSSPNNSTCRITPSTYGVVIYEMGVCTSHPFGANTAGVGGGSVATMDESSCSVVFSNTSGFTYDVAAALNAPVDLEGINTRPANGTYGFPYIILGKTFTVNAEISAPDGNTYYADGSGGATTTAPGTDYPNVLNNFDSGTCYSGFIGASIPVGTIDAFLINDARVRRDSTDYTSDECTGVTKLVGVINLTTPFTITSETSNMQFDFIITNYGAQAGVDGAGAIADIASGPFSGSILVK